MLSRKDFVLHISAVMLVLQIMHFSENKMYRNKHSMNEMGQVQAPRPRAVGKAFAKCLSRRGCYHLVGHFKNHTDAP